MPSPTPTSITDRLAIIIPRKQEELKALTDMLPEGSDYKVIVPVNFDKSEIIQVIITLAPTVIPALVSYLSAKLTTQPTVNITKNITIYYNGHNVTKDISDIINDQNGDEAKRLNKFEEFLECVKKAPGGGINDDVEY